MLERAEGVWRADKVVAIGLGMSGRLRTRYTGMGRVLLEYVLVSMTIAESANLEAGGSSLSKECSVV